MSISENITLDDLFSFCFQDNSFLKESGVLSARNVKLVSKFLERFRNLNKIQ
jgi:hypothetical protein